MPKGRIEVGLAAAVLLAAMPAHAQEFEPRTDYERLTERPKPLPAIPAGFEDVVAAVSPDRLVVAGLSGNAIPVDISWYEPQEFLMHAGDRYFGLAYLGYEAFGYVLVDRAMAGQAAIIDTGAYPMLSPEGRYLAAAELSESGYGNLNGVALWEVLPNRTVQRFFTDALPHSWGWRVDGWHSPTCASISAISPELQPQSQEEWDTMWETAPRQHYSLVVADAAIALYASYDALPCGEDRAGE